MKRISAVLITFIMLIVTLSPAKAFAENDNKITAEQAVNIAASAFNISTDEYEFISGDIKNLQKTNIWELNWKSKKNSKDSIRISVNSENGDILNMSSSESSIASSDKSKNFSKAQAQEGALNALKTILGKKFTEIKLQEGFQSNSTDSYIFNFTRYINGIPFNENGLSIALDKSTLKVKKYNLVWDNNLIPSYYSTINIEDAKNIFRNELGIELVYTPVYDSELKTYRSVPVYTLKSPNTLIDASSGEILTSGNASPIFNYLNNKMKKQKSESAVLSPAEIQSLGSMNQLISRESAIEKAKTIIDLSSLYTPKTSNPYVNPNDNSLTWFLSWSYMDKETGSYGYTSAEIDAVDSSIKSFSMYGSDYEPLEGSEFKYTKNEARKIAEDFLKSIEPEKFSQTEYRDYNAFVDKTSTGYNLTYIRKYNDILCPANNLSLYIDAYTGKVMQYNMNWKNIGNPSPVYILDINDAYDILYSKLGFSMKYVKYQNPNNKSASPEIRLVYSFDNSFMMMDSSTGNMMDFDGNIIEK
jgi:hypothetical protein